MNIDIVIEDTENKYNIVEKNFINVKLRQTKPIIENTNFNLISDDDVNYFHYHDSLNMINKINNITDILYNIQYCTTNRRSQSLTHISNQPCTLNNNEYNTYIIQK